MTTRRDRRVLGLSCSMFLPGMQSPTAEVCVCVRLPRALKYHMLTKRACWLKRSYSICAIYVHAYRVRNAYDYTNNMYVCNLIYQCKQIYFNVNK